MFSCKNIRSVYKIIKLLISQNDETLLKVHPVAPCI